MTRDMSDWPEVLLEALAPGVAPTLDRLAEETRGVFWAGAIQVGGHRTDTGEELLDVFDLLFASISVLDATSTEDKHRALLELWGLNEYALPYPTSYESLFDGISVGGATAKDLMMDLLYAAIHVRCRLDEATEAEERIRRHMRQFGRKDHRSEAEALAAALAGKSTLEEDEPSYMTIAELVGFLQDDPDEGKPELFQPARARPHPRMGATHLTQQRLST